MTEFHDMPYGEGAVGAIGSGFASTWKPWSMGEAAVRIELEQGVRR